MFYRYIEKNTSSEGEVWTAFIKVPKTDTEKALVEALLKLTNASDDDEEEDSYYFEANDDDSVKEYTKEEVSLLLGENSLSLNGYNSEYCIGSIKESVLGFAANLKDDTPWYEVQELLYKMAPIKED